MDETKLKLLLGNNIKKLREQKGFTQEKFCNLAMLEQPSLSNIETGKTLPNLTTIISIIKTLKVSPNSLFDFLDKYDEIDLKNENDAKIISYILNLPEKTKLAILEILKSNN